jgi:hypothetical protein
MPTVPESEATPSPEASPVEINKPIWAVDLRDEIRALSTFDLWMGLSRGELSTEVRVWRMGRECWCPIREVPELACALSPDSVAAVARAEEPAASEESATSSPLRVAHWPATQEQEPAERVTLGYSERREAPEPSAVLDTSTFDAWMAEPVLPPPARPAREPCRLVRARKIRRHLAVAAGAAAIVLVAIGLAAPSQEVAQAAERPATAHPASPRTAEAIEDVVAGGRVPAPRAKRVSPSHAGQQRRR